MSLLLQGSLWPRIITGVHDHLCRLPRTEHVMCCIVTLCMNPVSCVFILTDMFFNCLCDSQVDNKCLKGDQVCELCAIYI